MTIGVESLHKIGWPSDQPNECVRILNYVLQNNQQIINKFSIRHHAHKTCMHEQNKKCFQSTGRCVHVDIYLQSIVLSFAIEKTWAMSVMHLSFRTKFHQSMSCNKSKMLLPSFHTKLPMHSSYVSKLLSPQSLESNTCCIIVASFDNFNKTNEQDHLGQGVVKLNQHWLTKKLGPSTVCHTRWCCDNRLLF